MKRPEVIINCAMSADGKIALPDGGRLTISSEEDLARVHRLRNRCDAILVGIGTIRKDDPSLLVKPRFVKRPRSLLRIVLDSRGRIPLGSRVLDTRAPTLIAVTEGHVAKLRRKIGGQGVKVRAFGKGRVDLLALLGYLHEIGIGRLMVEGGGTVIWSFLEKGQVDQLSVFVGNMVVGGHGPSLAGGPGAKDRARTIRLEAMAARRMKGGILLRYRPHGATPGPDRKE